MRVETATAATAQLRGSNAPKLSQPPLPSDRLVSVHEPSWLETVESFVSWIWESIRPLLFFLPKKKPAPEPLSPELQQAVEAIQQKRNQPTTGQYLFTGSVFFGGAWTLYKGINWLSPSWGGWLKESAWGLSIQAAGGVGYAKFAKKADPLLKRLYPDLTPHLAASASRLLATGLLWKGLDAIGHEPGVMLKNYVVQDLSRQLLGMELPMQQIILAEMFANWMEFSDETSYSIVGVICLCSFFVQRQQTSSSGQREQALSALAG